MLLLAMAAWQLRSGGAGAGRLAGDRARRRLASRRRTGDEGVGGAGPCRRRRRLAVGGAARAAALGNRRFSRLAGVPALASHLPGIADGPSDPAPARFAPRRPLAPAAARSCPAADGAARLAGLVRGRRRLYRSSSRSSASLPKRISSPADSPSGRSSTRPCSSPAGWSAAAGSRSPASTKPAAGSPAR